jgi:hypothetical protein
MTNGTLNDRVASTRRGAVSPARLLLPLGSVGVLLVCAGLMLRGHGETETASSVARRIQQTALAGARPDAQHGAGMLGPWMIAAERVDPATGRLVNFRLQTPTAMISATSADILVDPRDDSFSFDLHDVVVLHIPAEDEEEIDARMVRMDEYRLGPVPYGADIVPDDHDRLPRLDAPESERPMDLDPSPLVEAGRGR